LDNLSSPWGALQALISEATTSERVLYHLSIYQFGNPANPRSRISSLLVEDVRKQLQQITTPPDQTDIDVWIESPGGDAHAAYKVFLGLRNRCSTFRIVVPDYAKSAATLFALGADKIFMSPDAELGPLDVQLPHPDLEREGDTISGLDQSDLLRFLGQAALDLAVRTTIIVTRNTELPRVKVLPEAMKFSSELLTPLFSKLDPQLIHQADQLLKIANHYAVKMLERRNVEDEFRMSGARSINLLDALVKGYPEHGCIIDRKEAKVLGLPIENAEDHPRWSALYALHQSCEEKRHNIVRINKDSDFDNQTPISSEN
jgi:hypothetical protein